MKWKGRRQSTNVEDRTLEPLEEGVEGEVIFGTGEVYRRTPEVVKREKEINAAKEVGRKRNNVPTPTPRPKITKTQVTPGKWKTN